MGIYKAQFVSRKNETYIVEIGADWLSDKTLTLAADPVHLVVNEGPDAFPGLRTTECEINVLTTNAMLELFSEDMMAVTVVVKRDEDVIFAGFLETSEWEMPCAPGIIEPKQLVAVDALSAYLQKPCYERSYRTMLSVMDELKDEMSQKLGVGVRYDGPLLDHNSIYGAYVNIDSLQPVDLYTKTEDDAGWTKWGKIVNDFARATGSTVMMVGDRIVAYYMTTKQEVWCSEDEPIETRLRNTTMQVKMANSVTRVTQAVKTLPNINAPEAVDARVANWTVYAGNDRPIYTYFGKAVAYHYTNGLEKYWGEGPDWPQNLDRRTKAVCSVSYADTRGEVDPSAPSEWMVGVNAISRPVHVYPAHGNDGYATITLRADIHTNAHEHEEQMLNTMAGIPCLWSASVKEDITNMRNSTIALLIAGVTISPTEIKPLMAEVHSAHHAGDDESERDEYVEDAPNWLPYYYYYSVPYSLLEEGEYKPQVLVRSARRGGMYDGMYVGYSFAKKIRLVGPGYDADELLGTDGYENKTLSSEASGKATGREMRLECDMCNEPWYSGYVDGSDLRNPLEQLARQYATPQPIWTATADDDGYDPLRKAYCNGRLCSQVMSDWNLRDNEVTAKLMPVALTKQVERYRFEKVKEEYIQYAHYTGGTAKTMVTYDVYAVYSDGTEEKIVDGETVVHETYIGGMQYDVYYYKIETKVYVDPDGQEHEYDVTFVQDYTMSEQNVIVRWDVWDYGVFHGVWTSTGTYLLTQKYEPGETIVPPTDTYTSAEADKPTEDYELHMWDGYTDGMTATTSIDIQGRFRLKAAGDARYTVNAYADPEDGGSVTGSGTYLAGTTASLTATASVNYEFDRWEIQVSGESEPRTSRSNPYTIAAISADVNAYAKFKAKQNGGSGDDTDDPGEGGEEGGDDDNPGYYIIKNATVQVITKAPWGGGYAQTNVNIDVYWKVDATASDDGGETKIKSVTIGLHYTFGENTSETERISPEQTYVYTFPDGTAETVRGFCYQEAYAGSNPKEVTITTSVSPADGGSVTGSGTYAVGDEITLQANVNNGFRFVSWTGGGVTLTDNPLQFTAAIGIPTAWTANFATDETKNYEIVQGSEDANQRLLAPATGGTGKATYKVTVYEVSKNGSRTVYKSDTKELQATFAATTQTTASNDGLVVRSATATYRITINGVAYTKEIRGNVYQSLFYYDGISANSYRIKNWASADGGKATTICDIVANTRYGNGTIYESQTVAKSYTFTHTFTSNLYCDDKYYDPKGELTGRIYREDKTVTFDGEQYTFSNIPFCQECAFGYNDVSGFNHPYEFVNRRSVALTIHYWIREDKDVERTCQIDAGPGVRTTVSLYGTICNRNTDGDGFQAYATET